MEWQSMDVAPTDRSVLLVVDGRVCHGWHEELEGRDVPWVVGCEGFSIDTMPTAWMDWQEPPRAS